MNAVSGRNREEDPNAPVPVEETSEMQQQQQDPCAMYRMDFNNCLEVNKDKGISECQIFFDSFKRCQERVQRESMNEFH